MTHRITGYLTAAFVSAGLLSAAEPALASGSACSVSGTAAAAFVNYNPFSAIGVTNASVTLVLNRYVVGSAKTQNVNFYLTQPVGSPSGYDVTYSGQSVLQTLPNTRPLSTNGQAASGTIAYDFGGTGNPDSANFTFLVSIPAGQNLTAGQYLSFGIVYECKGTGGLANVTTPTTLASAITIQINVQSALQASYVGAPLAFGEISTVSDPSAPSHSVGGAIRVASSGPFQASLTSANGFRMTYPGGNLTTTNQTVRYQVHFLGQTASNSAPVFTPVVCSRAGISGELLPITAALLEGGSSKIPSNDYRDTVTVTVTPLAASSGAGALSCPSL